MKCVLGLLFTIVCTSACSQTADAGYRRPAQPSRDQIVDWLNPLHRLTSEERRQGEVPFEVPTEVPGITIQNLPTSQQAYRMNALKAISKDIVKAAIASEAAHATTAPEGWTRIRVPRKRFLFGANETIVLLKIDKNQKTVEISIRGTANFDDALRDLNAVAVQDSILGFPVHSGFSELATDVYRALRKEKINSAMMRVYSFSLYGHSLGGSTAAVVAMYLHKEGATVARVVTFGAPRYLTNEGAHIYQVLNESTVRIVRCDDVIPFVPPPNFFGWTTQSYQANGSLLLLLRPPYFDYSVGIEIERDFVHQLRTELSNVKTKELLAYGHRMSNYLASVGAFTPKAILNADDPLKMADAVVKPIPVAYSLKNQTALCPKRLGADKK